MRKLVVIIFTLAITGLIALLLFRSAAPVHYQLTVINNTAATIDLVRVFGSGAVDDATYRGLEAGQSVELTVGLAGAGQLRFEVIRGHNRIDAIFEENLESTDRNRQWLILNSNNRFVFRDQRPDLKVEPVRQ